MHKFAHMPDIHLGAHRDQVLQKLELETFEGAIDKCIDLEVDFILIFGDFFHIGIPELSIVNKAILKMREVQLKGIPIYVIHGSHDYTSTGASIIDLLDTAGIITNISRWKMKEEKLHLNFLLDQKTGAKITGILALCAFKAINVGNTFLQIPQGTSLFLLIIYFISNIKDTRAENVLFKQEKNYSTLCF